MTRRLFNLAKKFQVRVGPSPLKPAIYKTFQK